MSERPLCYCGRPRKKAGKGPKGKQYYNKYCAYHNRISYEKKWKFKLHKKDTCEACGFAPENPCQLDVDHIDGNNKNCSPENLQTLCANCHRIKTHLNSEHINKVP